MPFRALVFGLCLAFAAPPVWAAKEWYAHYEDAQKLLARGRCKEAIQSLREAQALKPRSALYVQTYGVQFVDEYLPYYWEGVCRLRLGEYGAAIELFNREEGQGAIKKRDRLYQDLRLQRENAERQRTVRSAQEQVQRLRRESDELQKTGLLDDALARLKEAQKGAELLDRDTQQQILQRQKSIQEEINTKREQVERAARAQRIEGLLAEGRRLQQEGNPSAALVRFHDVLAQDKGNAAALQGKLEAEERILALSTQQEMDAAFRRGEELFTAGQFEAARDQLVKANPTKAEVKGLIEKTQKILDGIEQQKQLRARLEALMAEAERLLAARKYPEALVKLTSALELDPGNPKARERLGLAERMTGDEIFERIFPNQAPLLTFIETPSRQVEGVRLALLGVATDDRGLTRLQYRRSGKLVAEQVLEPDRDTGAFPRTFRIEYVFPLDAGENQLAVTAVDTRGLERVETFLVHRRLRFYERRAFWPSMTGGSLGLVGLGLVAQRARRRRALRNRFNPYIAGAPVLDEEMFFGRQKLLARIMNVLHHNSLMITGERRIGKTTFLYHLKRALEADQATDYQFFPVFTDLQGVPEESFFHTIMSDLVEALHPAPETLAGLRFQAEQEGDYDGRDFSHDVQRIIEELKTRTPRQVKLTLLIDEVDVLNEYSGRINQRLRAIFMKTFSEHLVAVMSGVGIKRVWTSEGSPWYNFFDEVELSAFTREEAEELIREPVEGVFRYQPEAVERILAMSQLKPYVIQKFCIHAVNRMLEEGRTLVRATDVEAVKDAVLFEGRSALLATPEAQRASA